MGGSYPSAEVKSVYSTAPADWASYYVHFRTNTLGKSMNPLTPSSYGLNSITAVLLQGWLWYQITHKSWYALKQRNTVHINLNSISFSYIKAPNPHLFYLFLTLFDALSLIAPSQSAIASNPPYLFCITVWRRQDLKFARYCFPIEKKKTAIPAPFIFAPIIVTFRREIKLPFQRQPNDDMQLKSSPDSTWTVAVSAKKLLVINFWWNSFPQLSFSLSFSIYLSPVSFNLHLMLLFLLLLVLFCILLYVNSWKFLRLISFILFYFILFL